MKRYRASQIPEGNYLWAVYDMEPVIPVIVWPTKHWTTKWAAKRMARWMNARPKKMGKPEA